MARKTTLRQLAEDYLAWLGNRTTAATTRHHLKTVLDKFGGWQPHRIGPAQVQEYLAEQREQGRTDVTCVHRAKILRTVLAWGVRMGKAPENKLAGMRLPAPKSRRIAPPTLEEIGRMCEHAAPHIRRVLLIGLACGPRIGPSELFSFFAVGRC